VEEGRCRGHFVWLLQAFKLLDLHELFNNDNIVSVVVERLEWTPVVE
jgi:hypothetical protein